MHQVLLFNLVWLKRNPPERSCCKLCKRKPQAQLGDDGHADHVEVMIVA